MNDKREPDIVGCTSYRLEFPFHGSPRSVLASGSVPGREALSALVSIRLLAGCNVFEAFAIAKRERSKVPPPFFVHLRFLTRITHLSYK